MFLRYLAQLRYDINEWSSFLVWPLLDITLFGCIALWLESDGTTFERQALLAGVTLWQFFTKVNFSVSISLFEEMWTHNIVHIFSSPIHIGEWFLSVLLKGACYGITTLILNIAFVWLVFDDNLLTIGLPLLYMCIQLYISGIALGTLGAGLILRYGTHLETLLYTLDFLILPISGAFYPLNLLPEWMQSIGYCLPFYYLFENLQKYLETGVWHISPMIYATLYNILFLLTLLTYGWYAYVTGKRLGHLAHPPD